MSVLSMYVCVYSRSNFTGQLNKSKGNVKKIKKVMSCQYLVCVYIYIYIYKY